MTAYRELIERLEKAALGIAPLKTDAGDFGLLTEALLALRSCEQEALHEAENERDRLLVASQSWDRDVGDFLRIEGAMLPSKRYALRALEAQSKDKEEGE